METPKETVFFLFFFLGGMAVPRKVYQDSHMDCGFIRFYGAKMTRIGIYISKSHIIVILNLGSYRIE